MIIRRFFALTAVLVLLMSGTALALKDSTLYKGCRGAAVQTMQQALQEQGYLTGKADGIFGAQTEKAVKAFQKAHHLKADGLAGTGTLTVLYGKQPEQVSVTPAPAATPAPASEPAAATASSASDQLFEGNYTTLRSGAEGHRVIVLQQALKELGYLTGKADGKFGTKTENAVKAFQKANKLTADGLAGSKTLKKLETAVQKAAESAAATATAVTDTAAPVTAGTLSKGSRGEAVTRLQQALADLKYEVSVTGTYDEATRLAVVAFQQRNRLTADGLAGAKTQTKLYSGSCVTGDTPLPTVEDGAGILANPPSANQLVLLHWFNDIKPTLKNGQTLLVYDPASGLAWHLRLFSLGRHADAEPLTLLDTQIMVKAFGNQNTWNQKAVWVQLPYGTWTVASTHDMPHESQSVKDNGFNGHLCVHFLRTMSECEKNDPDYGVSNQKTIRTAWKNLTGETVSD